MKFIVEYDTGEKVWLNLDHAIKLVKTADNRYFLYLINGETYEIDHRTASKVENFFDER